MKLVDEIIDLLSASKPSLENALFKAQVLAHKLGEQDLKQWVDSELKGYINKTSLPPYRILKVTVLGDFSNGAYRYSEQALPMMKLDEWIRDRFQNSYLKESIAVIEAWSVSDSTLSIVIPPEFYGHFSKGLGGGYSVERAWGQHSMGAMLQVVVEVRSRLLDFALQLSDRIPREPDVEQIKQVSKEFAVGEIFKNAVFGDNATIVVGSGSVHGISNSVTINDIDSLSAALKLQSVSDLDIALLREAIGQDAGDQVKEPQTFGPRVRKWIGAMVGKAGSSGWQVGMGAAGNVLASALGAYYGFDV